MICYKDKTFCKSDCTVEDCWRYFGDKDRKGARLWWSHDPDNAPIAFCDFSANCERYMNNEN